MHDGAIRRWIDGHRHRAIIVHWRVIGPWLIGDSHCAIVFQ